MKKLFTVCGFFLISLFAFAAAEAEVIATETETTETNKVLHDFKDFSHWSIQVNGGFSQFDGDANQRYDQLLSSSHLLWTVGLDVEYSFNPAWGLIANFQYMPYQGHTSSTKYGKNYFRGNMYAPSLMLSMNLLNLFGQYRSSAAWNWYLNAGVGVVFYDVKNTAEGDNSNAEAQAQDVEDGKNISIPLGTQVEYNINDYLAVGLSGYYRLHNKDNFEGQDYTKGTMNDGEFYVTASLRVKLAPNAKEGGHMRNISMMDYHNKRTGKSNIEARLDSLEKRVKVLEDTVANNILPRLDELEKQHATTPDEDGDGVPDFRDRQANTPKGTFVNYWGEGIPQDAFECCDKVNKVLSALGMEPTVDYDMSVYYAFDKAAISAKARKNIEKAVQKLQENPELKVELRGYCDFPGSNDYNLKLSEKRVNAVKAELVKAGIAEERITVQPQGALANPPKAELKNRRCDFFFY